MNAPVPTERSVQRGILKMAAKCFPDVLIHHSPAGAHLAGGSTARFKQIGALKGDGMKVGWPDLECVWAGGICYMEVKRSKGSVTSTEQAAMLVRLTDMGWPARIVRSVDEAHAFLTECGAPRKVAL